MKNKYEQMKLENQLCFPFYAISREIIKLYKPLLEPFGLTYTQYICMLVLWEEKRITCKSLGVRLHLDSGTLTPVLKKLEAKKLINKYRTPEDDRVVMVELTEEGAKLQEEVASVPYDLSCQVKMSEAEYEEVKKMLTSLMEQFQD